MATNAITALGATVVFNGNTIGEIMSYNGNRLTNIKEILTCDSPDETVEKIAGALNTGECSTHLVYDGSAAGVYNDLNTDYHDKTSATLTITFSDTSSLAGTAIISSLGDPSWNEGDGVNEIDATFARSGRHTYTDVA